MLRPTDCCSVYVNLPTVVRKLRETEEIKPNSNSNSTYMETECTTVSFSYSSIEVICYVSIVSDDGI